MLSLAVLLLRHLALVHVLASPSLYLLVLPLDLLMHLGLLLPRHHLLLQLSLIGLLYLAGSNLIGLGLLGHAHWLNHLSCVLPLHICILLLASCLHLLSLLLIAIRVLHRAFICCRVLPLVLAVSRVQVFVQLEPVEVQVFPLLGVLLWQVC